MRHIILSFILFTAFTAAIGQNQNIGINTNTPDGSAVLEIFSEQKGLLIPRLSSTQRLAISNPANGLMVFDLDEKDLFFYDASTTSWKLVGSSAPEAAHLWEVNGDNMYKTNLENIGIGTSNPIKDLHLKGDGNENIALAMSTADSSYSIIIEIDETNDGFNFIGSDGVTSKVLMFLDRDGNVGYNTTAPSKSLNIVGNGIQDAGIAISNNAQDFDIIIEIDETNDAFELNSSNGTADKSLMYIDNEGLVGFNTKHPNKNLHIKSNGNENAAIAITNADSTYSIILEIDETNDGFQLIGSDGITAKNLMYIDKFGKLGLGTSSPQKNIDLKGDNSGDNTAIQAANNSGEKKVIIEIDETNDGVGLLGENNGTLTTMLFADQNGKLGMGTKTPESSLHLVSDTENPSLKMTKTGYDYSYTMGYDASSSNFVLSRDSIAGGEATIMEVNSIGNVMIKADGGFVDIESENEINLETPLVKSRQLKTEKLIVANPTNGGTVDVEVDLQGNLNIPGFVNGEISFIDFRIQNMTVGATQMALLQSSNGIVNNSTLFNASFNQPEIFVTDAGYYELSYAIAINQPVLIENELKVELRINGVPNNTYTNYFVVSAVGKQTLTIPPRIINLGANDNISLHISIENYLLPTQNFNVFDEGSFIHLKKIY